VEPTRLRRASREHWRHVRGDDDEDDERDVTDEIAASDPRRECIEQLAEHAGVRDAGDDDEQPAKNTSSCQSTFASMAFAACARRP